MMKKKNVFRTLLLTVFVGMGLVACSDDDDDKSGVTEVYVEEPGTLNKLLGEDRFGIERLTVSGTLDYEDQYLLGELAVDGALSELDLTDATLEENTIEGEMFYGSGLVTIKLPKTLETIGEMAFSQCKFLKEIVIPASVKTVMYQAFEDCAALTTVTIEGYTSIGSNAFSGCGGITTLRLESTTVPTLPDNCGLYDHAENITVYLPAGMLDAYEHVYGNDWGQQFKEVIEAPDTDEE